MQTLRAGCCKAESQTNKHTNRQGRLQYTAQLSTQCNNKYCKIHVFSVCNFIFTHAASLLSCMRLYCAVGLLYLAALATNSRNTLLTYDSTSIRLRIDRHSTAIP